MAKTNNNKWMGLALLCLITLVIGVAKADNDVRVSVDKKGAYQRVFAEGYINSSADKVWSQIIDFNNHAQFMPNVVKSKVIGKKGKNLLVYKEMQVAFSKVAFTLEVNVDNAKMRQSWRQHEGDFAVNEGYWQVSAVTPNRTKVEYAASVEPAFYIPDWVKTLLTQESVPKIYAAIENRVNQK